MDNDIKISENDPICYKGCSFYPRDYKSLNPGQWLRTQAIHFLLVLLQDQFCQQSQEKSFKDKVAIFDPFITQMIIFMGDEQCLMSLKDKQFFKNRWLLIPINAEDNSYGDGNHWYLLVFDTEKKQLITFDSSRMSRKYETTQIMKKKLQQMSFLHSKNKIQIQIISNQKVSQQKNTYDCGVFTVGYVESLLNHIISIQSQQPGHTIDLSNLMISQDFSKDRQRYQQKIKQFIKKLNE